MFVIGEAVIDETISQVSFQCDLSVCQGACCVIPGGRGAPLDDAERNDILAALPLVEPMLSERSRAVIQERGPFEGIPGDYATTCVDDRECVFVIFDNGIAHCAFERAYRAGTIRWQKPLSCHLYPIRVGHGRGGVLRYEEIAECAGGRQGGRQRGIALHDFLKDSLTRKFGAAWYEEFRHVCETRRATSSSI